MSHQPSASPSAPGTGAGEIRLSELLRDRPFALYLVGQTSSGAGGALSSVALAFAVLSISHSAAALGLVLLASRLPGIALTLIGGVIADRCSRRSLAVGADLVRTVLQGVTGALLLSGHATVLGLAALQLVAGGASAIFNPAAGALAAGVAPRGRIRRAGSLLGITTAIAQTGGLAISGVLVALAGPGTSFLIDGATFAVSSITLALIPAQPSTAVVRRPLRHELRDGVRAVRDRGWLVSCAAHETVVNVLALSPFFVLGPLIAARQLGGAPAWSAIALGYVLGNLAAAHLTYHWEPHRPVLAAMLTSTALTPLLILLGIGAPLWMIAPSAFLAGLQTTVYNTLTTSVQQANLPDRVLARASAITGLGSTLLVPVGMGLAGLVAAEIGTRTVLVGGAALVLGVTAICTALPATRVRLELDRSA